jgi:hypothetical protein
MTNTSPKLRIASSNSVKSSLQLRKMVSPSKKDKDLETKFQLNNPESKERRKACFSMA